MWRMLQQEKSDDYVLATGKVHSVKDFLAAAFESVDLNWEDYVVQDPRYMRPSEGTRLVGDASKAKQRLGWVAETSVPGIASKMVQADRQSMQSTLPVN